MKFNFENFAKENIRKIKPYILPAVFSFTLNSCSKDSVEINKKDTIKNNNISISENNFNDIENLKEEKTYYVGYEDYAHKGSLLNIENNKNNLDDDALKNEIFNLQNEIKEVSNLTPIIKKGTFSIVSRGELSQKEPKTIKNNGIDIISPLDLKYITEGVLNNIINDTSDFKIITTDFQALGSMKELVVEDYVDVPKDSRYFIPEYYLVLENKKDSNSGSILIEIKIFSSKNNKVIKKIEFENELPNGDEFIDKEFLDLVNNKIIPNLSKIIKLELTNNLKNS